MHRLTQFQFAGRLLLVTAALFQMFSCTGYIQSPTPATPPTPAANIDRACLYDDPGPGHEHLPSPEEHHA